jgi:hypothetical protein
MTLREPFWRTRNRLRDCLRKECRMVDLGTVMECTEWRYNMVVEDVQAARQFAACVMQHLPAGLGRLPRTVRDWLASLEARLRLERRLDASSS